MIKSQPKHLSGLHGLRAIAASAIIIFHLSPLTTLPLPTLFTFVKNYFGLGVALFFVISGFSLTYSNYYRAVTEKNWARSYLIKRFFRIAPLFYFMICVTSLFLYLRGVPTFGLPAYLLNLTFTFNFVPGYHESIVFAGWTIGVEMIFYALLPVILLTIRSLRPAIWLYILSVLVSWAAYDCMLALSVLPVSYARLSFLSNIEFFCAGILGFFIFNAISLSDLSKLRVVLYCCTICIVVLILTTANWSGLDTPVRRSLWAVVFMTACIWQSYAPTPIMAGKALGYMGERSYSMYLLHPLTIVLSSWVVLAAADKLAAMLGAETAYLLCSVLVIALVTTLSGLTYKLIEAPFIRLASSTAPRKALDASQEQPVL